MMTGLLLSMQSNVTICSLFVGLLKKLFSLSRQGTLPRSK